MGGLALALSRTAASTLRGAPFGTGNARLVAIAAVAIAVGSWSARDLTHSVVTLADLGWRTPGALTLQIPFLPLLLGSGLGAVAAVFRAGERVQRDTDGVV